MQLVPSSAWPAASNLYIPTDATRNRLYSENPSAEAESVDSLTCRQRHVKCDEARPTCAKCAKKNRTCRYPDPNEVSSRSSRRSSRAKATRDSNNAPRVTQLAEEEEDSYTAAQPASSVLDISGHGDGVVDVPPSASPFEAVLAADASVSPFLATFGLILLEGAPRGVEYGSPHTYDPPVPLALHVDYDIQLSGTSVAIFRNYVDVVSLWIDSFSHDQPFRRQVPILALRCPVLLNACLALSAKQLNLRGLDTSLGLAEGDAIRYYRLALGSIRELLLNPASAHSDELLAACTILSTYEMIDVKGESLGSHLTGVASLLQTRQVHGDIGGIRGACYWVFIRHEVWCNLRTGRQLSLNASYWYPPHTESFSHLNPESIANRAIFLFAQCIDFCNGVHATSQSDTGIDQLSIRDRRATELQQFLDEWKSKLPLSMVSFTDRKYLMDGDKMTPMNFLFPQSAVANQVHHASKILLHLHRTNSNVPFHRSLINCTFISVRRKIERHRREIFKTANSIIPDAQSFLSCQCLYIAGLVTEDPDERRRTLELIQECQQESGRKTGVLSDDLKRLWAASGSDDDECGSSGGLF